MELRDVERALRAHGCRVLSESGPHTKWGCPCGARTTPVPGTAISPGVVRSIGKRMECLPKGWLQ
ncbi:type II toxin-antitoxin system HicA family toxin [Pseudonocardia alni]|jgi:predicted RNA binding protein YcfA (HicA-like mRNA interferase family)|uniref:HicA-like toxin of HicAB toxin-antitoxin system n=1 Tax=Pseudonocardia alni TaxID=33907 RepID=A0AA44UUT0_PSEA5|nr:type II toxin-antitoxin system HicA family toxin [Pseudonocardia alni]NWJ75080.1 type II toxin-antitoxin system HicA family toxin [Pseudonocardia pini]PKB41263.1 HicA-like toxin of HicAB toxin-antitoxin system [Pseudonocardia alni]